VTRRRFLQAAAAMLAGYAWLARAQQRMPLADMHSHYGMVSRRQMLESGFAEDLRANRVALTAWKAVPDANWLRLTPSGIEQAGEPRAGALGDAFTAQLDRMLAYIEKHKLKKVLSRPDVDACLAGESGIVLASEGADFLEGQLDRLAPAYEKGLRHLQLVHYIRTPVGDLQTSRPSQSGLSALGKQLVEACNARGILVDLSHSSGQVIDQALAISSAPVVWSHGWVDSEGGSWNDQYGYLQRRLSLDHAKKIAAKGGVVGLWAFGLQRPTSQWPVSRGDHLAYAEQLAKLVRSLGPDHVAIGTDIEGLGPNFVVNTYEELRAVIAALEAHKLSASVIERVAYGNYARVLNAALKA
jgi:membrane dipeptidase